MASLHLLCANPFSPLSTKYSHLVTHKKPSHRLRVSCQNQNDTAETSQVKLDRRNMLLGLGGLYGATNLISTPGQASAEPIPTPELNSCHIGKNWNKGGKPLEEKCCLPYSDKVIDFKLPPVTKMKLRRSAHNLTPEQIFKYNQAMDCMRRLPKDDPRSFMQQANVHCAYCNAAYYQAGTDKVDLQVHHNWLFFPFHRWYLYFYERILGKLINDPNFALPFWNWDNPKGMTIPPIFLDPKSALYDEKRDPKNAQPDVVVDLGATGETDPRQKETNNLSIIYTEMIRGNANACDFMGEKLSKGDQFETSGFGSVERGSHTNIHVWVGLKNDDDRTANSNEDLGNFYSAGRDPLFYCHHSNVDRMWTLWQYFLPSEKVPDKRILNPDFLNAQFLFWDENKRLVRVRVKDSLSNLKMGYEYERIDLPWLDYRPPPQSAEARVKRASMSAKKADKVFPLNLDKIVRIEIPKAKKGKADELLVINITADPSRFLKFDVFVNDEEDKPGDVRKASYAGTFAQVPSKINEKSTKDTIRLKLTDLYDDMDVKGDDTVIVTVVPRHKGPGVTIGGIKIIENPDADKTKKRDPFEC